MATAQDQARNIAQILLMNVKPVTRESIAAAVDQAAGAIPAMHDEIDREGLIADLETRFAIWIGQAQVIEDSTDHKEWLNQRRGSISWAHWDRYRKYLDTRTAPKSVESVHDLTDEILRRLEDPERSGSWDRRGL